MASQRKHEFVTPEQYLQMERTAERRSEYVSGEIFAMASPTKRHGQIVWNTSVEIGSFLRGKPCEGSSGISVAARSSYLVPDLVVYCDGGDFVGESDVLQNPIVIIEVLSKSTSGLDHGFKWMLYQQLSSLMHYVLISQYEPFVEVYTREPDGGWHYEAVSEMGSKVSLSAIDFELPLAAIYERVDFET